MILLIQLLEQQELSFFIQHQYLIWCSIDISNLVCVLHMSLKDNVFDTASGMNKFEKTAQMSKRPITFELESG